MTSRWRWVRGQACRPIFYPAQRELSPGLAKPATVSPYAFYSSVGFTPPRSFDTDPSPHNRKCLSHASLADRQHTYTAGHEKQRARFWGWYRWRNHEERNIIERHAIVAFPVGTERIEKKRRRSTCGDVPQGNGRDVLYYNLAAGRETSQPDRLARCHAELFKRDSLKDPTRRVVQWGLGQQ